MQIKANLINKFRSNNKVVSQLMYFFDKGERTIQLWIENNNPMLTTVDALKIIKTETGLSEDEILEQETAKV